MAKKAAKRIATGLGALSAAGLLGAVLTYRKVGRGKHDIVIENNCRPAYEKVTATYKASMWSFTSFDGLKLKAYYYQPQEPSHKYAILVHGYHGCYTDMMPFAEHYLEKGYNCLMPMLRGHGLSAGDYAGFGYYDHYDIMGYIDLIREKDEQAQIILHGCSMGAATVMMDAGEFLPRNVKAIIEDCGYTSAWDQLAYNLRTMYHLPPFPLLNLLDLSFRAHDQFSLKDASPIKAIAHSTVPVLFVPSDADHFVPFVMRDQLYDGCTSEKHRRVIPGARHCMSITTDPKMYWEKADSFLNNYIQ